MDANDIFKQICSIIEQSPQDISPISYKTWICTLKPLVFKDNCLYLIAPTDMHRRHVMTATAALHTYLITALNIVVNSPGADVVLVLESEAAAIMDTTIPAPGRDFPADAQRKNTPLKIS